MSDEQMRDVKTSDVVDVTSSDVAYGNSSALDKSEGSLWSRILQKIQLEPTPGTFAPGRWSNADLDPVPPEQRQWTTMNFVFYWANDAITPGSLRLGSSLYSLGLSWKLTLVAVALGHFLMAIALTLNGLVGARFNIPFTIQSRASFGFFFSFAMVIVRMVVAGFWYGINTYTGAECVDTILRAIWPSFANIPNHLPESANITTEMMISYVIYFIVVLPFHWIHPRNLKLFFTIKSCLCLPAVLGMVIWACTADGSGGGVDNEIFHRGNTVSGSALGWAFMSGLNTMLGNYGTLAVNINDFTRYAKKSRQTYVQLFIIPIAFLLMAFWGLVIVGSAERLYGELQWDPLTIMNRWNGSSKSRAGAVFVGAALLIAQMGTNLGANCISAANDLNAMFPKYINIRRGQYLIAVIGAWALTPWNILSSAEALVNFMDGYSIWLAPITGVLLADFYLVHRRFYAVHELYDPHGKYRYNRWGTNWRAALAWTVGWAPLLPGLAEAINSSLNISKGSSEIYDLGYLYGIFTSFTVYSVLSLVFPPRRTMVGREGTEGLTEA
ncbi:cytosine-purine permease [Saccharata proteae CBS 121410]|uniref:Cytosine-purine permease n=1 Tax=Saccharata proteae CBS 121410 TaxID=1314787 RepID=A0A9P4HR60_9PEZI|nr:cytosine-purine permease [Saccharata proteae CBS 121410]